MAWDRNLLQTWRRVFLGELCLQQPPGPALPYLAHRFKGGNEAVDGNL